MGAALSHLKSSALADKIGGGDGHSSMQSSLCRIFQVCSDLGEGLHELIHFDAPADDACRLQKDLRRIHAEGRSEGIGAGDAVLVALIASCCICLAGIYENLQADVRSFTTAEGPEPAASQPCTAKLSEKTVACFFASRLAVFC